MADLTAFTGNLGGAPELRFTPNGKAVATFSLGKTERRMDPASKEWQDGETLWLRVEVWNEQAENVAASLVSGSSVVVLGELKPNNYEKDGVKREGVKVVASVVAPSLRYATARIERKSRNNSGSGFASNNAAPAVSSNTGSEETPF